jgi:hypothetical protein
MNDTGKNRPRDKSNPVDRVANIGRRQFVIGTALSGRDCRGIGARADAPRRLPRSACLKDLSTFETDEHLRAERVLFLSLKETSRSTTGLGFRGLRAARRLRNCVGWACFLFEA